MNSEHIAAQLLLRAWPFPRGVGRLTDKLFRNISFSNDRETIRTTDGFDITVNPNNLIGRHLYLTGEFDRTTAEILCDFSEPGDRLLDIGSNIGYMSACFLQNVPGSSVIAVEPQPVVIDFLRTNMSRFDGRARVFAVALSDVGGELPFIIDRENPGGSRLAPEGYSGTVSVPVLASSQFFYDNGIDKIDLVKIDVEGHEAKVLSSCKGRLAQLQPRAVLFEDHDGRSISGGPIAGIFAEIGYDIFGIKKYLTKLELINGYFGTNDYIAISRQRDIPAVARKRYKLS